MPCGFCNQSYDSDEDGIQMAVDPELEDWPQYVEHFFEANGIVGDANAAKRQSTFLSVIGPAPYKLIRSLLSPELPGDKTFDPAHHHRK